MSKRKQRKLNTVSLKLPKYVQKVIDYKALIRASKSKAKVKKYQAIKDKYNISTYSYRQLKKFGASREDIIKYYERELKIIKGEYESERKEIAINNYRKAMYNAGFSDAMISKVESTLRGAKNFNKSFEDLPIITLFYMGDDYGGDDDNLNDELDMWLLRHS